MIIALLAPVSLWAQMSFEVSSEKDRFLIGDQFTLDLIVKAPVNARVEWPATPVDTAMHWHLVNRFDADTLLEGQSAQFIHKWIGTSFDSGYAIVPPLTVRINGQEYYSEPILLQIDLPETEEEYYDITDPLDGGIVWWRVVVWTVLGLILLIAIVLGIRRWIAYQKHRLANQPEAPLAEQAIAALAMAKDSQSDEDLGRAMSLLYREAGRRVGPSFAAMTREEQVKALNAWAPSNGDLWNRIVEEVNVIRFAGTASAEQIAQWTTQSLEWLQQTPQSEITSENDVVAQ